MYSTRYTPSKVYRVARRQSVNALTPWQYVGGGRFDDPQRGFRVLYTSTSTIGAYTERFQDFRPNGEFKGVEDDFELTGEFELAAIERPSGELPFQEFSPLFIGELSLPQDAELLDLTQDDTARHFASYFNRDLYASDFISDGSGDGTYKLCPPLSRLGYMESRYLAGIYSASKISPVDVQNVSIYEGESEHLRIAANIVHFTTVSHDDADLVAACQAIGVNIESPQEYNARRMSRYGF